MIRLRGLVWNTGLSFVLNLIRRAAGVLTFIAIGRLSGTHSAGLFSLALGYLAILTTLFVVLDDILIRESARRPRQTLPLLATYGTIRVGITVIAWLALLGILEVVGFYSVRDLTILTIITGSILLDTFGALSQAVLHAHGRFGWPLAATTVSTTVKLGGALFALANQQGLQVVVLAWPLGSSVFSLILGTVLVRHLRRLGGQVRFRIDRLLARQLIGLLPHFSATSILASLEFQLDVVLISVLLSIEAVAMYSAAVTIMMVVHMVSQAYRMVLYPTMVRSLAERPTLVRRLIGRSMLVLGGLALLAAIGVSAIAPGLVHLLYGERFEAVIPILQVLIWNVVFFFLDVPLVRFMMAADGQSTVWRTLLVSLSVNVIVNLVLIPRLGAQGAAYARLCSSAIFLILMGWQVSRRLNADKFDPNLSQDRRSQIHSQDTV